MNRWALFSGRFDPPNSGHFLTIERLMREYVGVIVAVLGDECQNYKREACSAREAKGIFDTHFELVLPPVARNKVSVIIYDAHFQHIDIADVVHILDMIDVPLGMVEYIAGNKAVIQHMSRLGLMPVRYYPRSAVFANGDVNSTDIRHKIECGDRLEDQYNVDFGRET